MKVIVVANQKGGVGKTTTATALASILTRKGYRTLLIDADQQGNSTDTYKAKIEGEATLYDVILEEERIPLSNAVQQTENGLIVASDPLLREADEKLLHDVEGLFRLQDAVEGSGFDYIIIDTAPTMNAILYNALISADDVIIPVTADRYGIQGLAQLNSTIQGIKRRQNRKLRIAGLLLVKYNPRTLLSKEVKESMDQIAKSMGTKVFKTTVRESTKAKEAQALRRNLIDYAPKATTTLDYLAFVDELLMEEE